MHRKANFVCPKTRRTLCLVLTQWHFNESCSSWYAGIS